LKGTTLSGNKINSKGAGEADQQASLLASVAVAVVEVMRNGNLVVRGEKQLALTEGSEIIQVSGIVRTDDIAPNNTVQSRRLANAQIVYRGTGDMANATKAGWGTSALLKLWPF
jgi:flagellar L-ring protein precursor FlgH